MAAYRLATSIQMDSTLPRDAVTINPVINDVLGGGDVQALVDEWMTAFKSWANITTTGQVTVKAYQCKPWVRGQHNFPVATAVSNPGTFWPTDVPREVALCLSFYSEHNVKRQRGRLFVPCGIFCVATDMKKRPSTTTITKVAQLADVLQELGGVDDDWSVYSSTDDQARKVTNWWVDDEWDTQRSRGLRPTTRTQGATSE